MSAHVLSTTLVDAEPSSSCTRCRAEVPVGDHVLTGTLTVPAQANAVIICAGPRKECVAETIRGQAMATLEFNLLTDAERSEDHATHGFAFNVPLLTERLVAATRWLAHRPATANFGFGYFGEGLAGAAALAAAAELGVVVDAVVCRHARVDFAANALSGVESPTLLICTKTDEAEVRVNRSALERLNCERQLQLVMPPCNTGKPETGTDCVGCSLAASWFKTYVRSR